jgi:hypothetical protein
MKRLAEGLMPASQQAGASAKPGPGRVPRYQNSKILVGSNCGRRGGYVSMPDTPGADRWFFAPVVDDPYFYRAIAPSRRRVMEDPDHCWQSPASRKGRTLGCSRIMTGGVDKLHEADVGWSGHASRRYRVKFGYSVTDLSIQIASS